MKLHCVSLKVAMPLLGVLIWIISIHSGTFSDASTLLPSPLTGYGDHTPDQKSNTVLQLAHKITEKDLNASVNFAINVVGFMKRLENNLMWSDIKVKSGTPSHGELISFGAEREAVKRGREALIAFKATQQLIGTYCQARELLTVAKQQECAKYMTRFTLNKTPLRQTCNHLSKQCTLKEYMSVYRSIDGTCNHANRASTGESFTAFSRLLFPDYLDGIHEPRRSVTREALPGSRAVVGALVKHGERTHEKATLAVMQWGQFLEHDLSRTAMSMSIHTNEAIECCSGDGGNLSPRFVHPFCFPIDVPSDDKVYAKEEVSCLSYVRSALALRADCTFGPTEQMNQATHYVDGSQLYGSTVRKSTTLRSFIDGKLETTQKGAKSYLALSQNPTEDCQLASKNSTCFRSGDSRVNFQPQLTVMHTIWSREHNRIAVELAKLNKLWDDEQLFQETRRIVIAEMQHITYNEWVKSVLDPRYVDKVENANGYKENINPAVSNGFANAAMRALKSLYDGKVKLYEEDRSVRESINLKNYFNNPTILMQDGVLDGLVRGLATQSSQQLDIFYAEELIDYLYTNGNFGFDVLSFDVQRGRDHGLPSYADYRTLCGLKRAQSFDDFLDVMSKDHVTQLSNVYQSAKDVDLIIGGLLEQAVGASVLGPTFSCIVADQIIRSKIGDRYFYTNANQPKPFSAEQLVEIQKVTLARVFCDNSDAMTSMQANVFEKVGSSNGLVSCGELPKMSLLPWVDVNQNNY